MLLGLVLYALGIVMTMKAGIGFAPWDVFHAGLSKVTGLSVGTASIIAGVAVLILVTALGEKLGLGTLGGMILLGIFIDIILKWASALPAVSNIAAGAAILVAGLFVISLGSWFYLKAAFGVGPRDNLMVVLARKTKLPVGLCRGIVELLVTLAGWLLGGPVGIGTMVTAVAIGLCFQLTFQLFRFDPKAVRHETLRDTIRAI